MPVLSSYTGAAVEPLAVVQEGQVAGPTVRVPLDGIYLCREKAMGELHILACTEHRGPSSLSPKINVT